MREPTDLRGLHSPLGFFCAMWEGGDNTPEDSQNILQKVVQGC